MMPVCVKWMIWVKSQKFYTHAFYVFKLKDLLQKTKTAYAHLKKMMFIAPTQFSDHVCPRPIKIL